MRNIQVTRCSWRDIPEAVAAFVEYGVDAETKETGIERSCPGGAVAGCGASESGISTPDISGPDSLVLVCRTETGQFSHEAGHELGSYLDEHEFARAEAFLFAGLKENYLYAHAALKRVLCSALKLPPQALKLCKGKFGKPYLEWPEKHIQFNLSRSSDFCAIRLSEQFRVGVDIEVHNHNMSASELAQAYFAQPEIQQWEEVRPSERRAFFFRLWALKEAFVKCLGTGLSVPLNSFSVSVLNAGQAEVRDAQGRLLSTQLNYGCSGDNISWAVARSSCFSECECVSIYISALQAMPVAGK